MGASKNEILQWLEAEDKRDELVGQPAYILDAAQSAERIDRALLVDTAIGCRLYAILEVKTEELAANRVHVRELEDEVVGLCRTLNINSTTIRTPVIDNTDIAPFSLTTLGISFGDRYFSRLHQNSEAHERYLAFKDGIVDVIGGDVTPSVASHLMRLLLLKEKNYELSRLTCIDVHEEGISFLSTSPNAYLSLAGKVHGVGEKAVKALIRYLQSPARR